MANSKNTGRQYPLFAVQQFDFADLVSGAVAALTVALPSNAIVVGGGVLVETAFNTGTSAVVDLGLAGGSASVLANDLDLKTTGFKPITGVFTPNYNGAAVTLTLTGVGADATAGAGKVFVEYLIVDKANEVQVA